MQDQNGALSWTGFLGKLVTILAAIFLILVVLSWLRCSAPSSGGVPSVSETGRRPGVTGILRFH